MSTSGISGGSATSWPSSSDRTGSTSTAGSSADDLKFSALMDSDTPYDVVEVNLPNGMSVGIFSFGGGGLDSAALKSIEDFVQKLASQDIAGRQASGTDDAGAGTDDASNVAGLDKIHVDLPNGISFEVRHSSGGQTTDSAAVMRELTDAAEELAEVFGKYSPASTAAATYANQAALSGRASQIDART